MLHRNPNEFQTGGLVIDLYRLVYNIFLQTENRNDKETDHLVTEVFHNHFAELPIDSRELKSNIGWLVKLLGYYSDKSGLPSTEFMAIVDPVDPDRSKDVIKWWAGN